VYRHDIRSLKKSKSKSVIGPIEGYITMKFQLSVFILYILLSMTVGFMSRCGNLGNILRGSRGAIFSPTDEIAAQSQTPLKPKRKTHDPGRTTIPGRDKQKEKAPPLFKPNNLIKELEDYFEEDKYILLLYNDNFNKRQYVATALQEVLGFDESMAEAIMMQAHTYGFAVAGEWYKELCISYAEKLNNKGIIAEARKSGGNGGKDE
jgi:ATP-dependent Clp protease adapter protein ClpS